MRAELLAPEVMKTLALTKDMEEFLGFLSQTLYHEDLGEGRGGVKARELEKIFNQRFLNRLERVIRFCPEALSKFLITYFFLKLEIHNLKRVLRGKFSKLPVNRIREFLIPLGPFQSISFEELLMAEDLEGFIDLLRNTPYAPLKESLVLCGKYDVLWPIEVRFNYLYVESIHAILSKIPMVDRSRIRRMVEIEADVENLLLAINWRDAEKVLPSLESVFQHAYGLPHEKIKELTEWTDLGEVIRGLTSPYMEILEPVLVKDFALVRTNLRRHIYEMAERGRVRNDFDLPCIMSYFISCEVEKEDLAAIAWGKEQEVEPKRILTYSVLPAYVP